jgi:hypothetical protein
MFKAGDVLFCTAAFFDVPVVSSGVCRFASVHLGNYPTALFVALWFLVSYE